METITRKCAKCGKVSELTNYINENKTCVICAEKTKIKYAHNRDVMIQRSKDYRLNNLEKEKARKQKYDSIHKEELKEKRQEYQRIEYYCPLCLYTIKLYKKQQHCKSLIHVNNLKYSQEQKEICILNSHIETNINHDDIDKQVKEIIDEDIKNNIIQQSVIDAIQNFNIQIENAMNNIY